MTTEKILREWYYENLLNRFEWGKWDCCLAAANWVQRITGEHPCPEIIGICRTESEANELICDFNGSLELLVTSYMGQPTTGSPAMGDIALVELAGKDTIAVCYGAQYIIPGKSGLGVFEDAKLKAAWRAKR